MFHSTLPICSPYSSIGFSSSFLFLETLSFMLPVGHTKKWRKGVGESMTNSLLVSNKSVNWSTGLNYNQTVTTETPAHTPLIVAMVLFAIIGVLIAGIIFMVCHDQKLRVQDMSTHGHDEKSNSTKKAKANSERPTIVGDTCMVTGAVSGKQIAGSSAASSSSDAFSIASKTVPATKLGGKAKSVTGKEFSKLNKGAKSQT